MVGYTRISASLVTLLAELGMSPPQAQAWLHILVDFTHGAALATAMRHAFTHDRRAQANESHVHSHERHLHSYESNLAVSGHDEYGDALNTRLACVANANEQR